MFCPRPTQVLPAIVHPTKCCYTCSQSNVLQPHVHPTHTTHVHNTNVQNAHYFPATQSFANTASMQDIGPQPGFPPPPTAGAGMMPGMMPGAMPGMMPGAMPGMMPGMGPGMGGPSVMGAYQPAPKPGTQVAGAYSGQQPMGYKKGCGC